MTTQSQYCPRCHCMVVAVLWKTVCSNSAAQLSWQCPNGDHRTREPHVPHSILKELGVSLDDLPTIRNDAGQALCEYAGCDRPGFEHHHWAPQGIFPDASLWPRSALCKYHHDLWHKTIEQHWRTKIDLERFGVTAKKKGKAASAGERLPYGDS